MTKSIFKTKTFWVGLVTAIYGVVTGNWELVSSGIAMLGLRTVTSQPIHIRKPAQPESGPTTTTGEA